MPLNQRKIPKIPKSLILSPGLPCSPVPLWLSLSVRLSSASSLSAFSPSQSQTQSHSLTDSHTNLPSQSLTLTLSSALKTPSPSHRGRHILPPRLSPLHPTESDKPLQSSSPCEFRPKFGFRK